MKLFIIPSWYPTKLHPENGSFFRNCNEPFTIQNPHSGKDQPVCIWDFWGRREVTARFGTRNHEEVMFLSKLENNVKVQVKSLHFC